MGCRFCAIGAAAIAIVTTSAPAFAQPPGEQIPGLIKPGQHILLVDDQGRELDGRIGAMTTDAFDLIVDDRPIRLQFERVIKIDHPRDGLGNGALIGMVTLPALMWFGHLTSNSSCAPTAHCPGMSAGVKLWATGSMAAFGAGLGVGFDALIQRSDRAIYRRGPARARATIAPAVGPGVRGAVVSLSW